MDSFTLWENKNFTITTPANPHIPYTEGAQIVVSPKQEVPNAWTDPTLSAATFRLAAQVCQIMEKLGVSQWFNIQANGNWGLLPGSKPVFHIHVFGRNKTSAWGKSLVLPETPGTYQNESMPESDRTALIEALKSALSDIIKP